MKWISINLFDCTFSSARVRPKVHPVETDCSWWSSRARELQGFTSRPPKRGTDMWIVKRGLRTAAAVLGKSGSRVGGAECSPPGGHRLRPQQHVPAARAPA
ncbi:UDP-N-acetylglucosamine 1-carboxyvinyltransferase [Frankliniella fusca]|uniref:UDP-N-acetylglucosamine 1-carboxyvinyltransferase n=1 Tax=Frankliniella fusca TaxID=407009 RepID=A0AAE1HJY0_9NEOP|nr:UDP-N-acetylglucosamine 1-carboxyvinyltransferase [Frankliniella fusca]